MRGQEEERESIYERKSEDRKINQAGRELVKFMSDHELVIVNGIKNKALLTSVQVKGNAVVDYIICEEDLLRKVKNFKTWHEEFSLVRS